MKFFGLFLENARIAFQIRIDQMEVTYTTKDQAIGGLICIACVAIAGSYTLALFWPALEVIRLWLVAIPVFIAFIALLGIGAWIGWTMATTPPPKPIEEIQTEETIETKGN